MLGACKSLESNLTLCRKTILCISIYLQYLKKSHDE